MLQLYYWNSVKALGGFNEGTALALAESKEQAIALIVYSFTGGVWNYNQTRQSLEQELQSTEPDIYTEPVGMYQYGPD